MVFTKGQEITVSHDRKGRFLAKVEKDFDTDKDEWAHVTDMDGEKVTFRISFASIKLYEGDK